MATGEKILKPTDLGYESALDLFQVPAANLGIQDTKFVTFKPANQYDIESNVKFRIASSGISYIDLREIYLHTTVRITRADGKLVPAKPRTAGAATAETSSATGTSQGASKTSGLWRVGPVNNLGNSLWDSVELSLNGTVIHGGQSSYAHRAMMNVLLGVNEASDQELECSLFIKDTSPYVGDVDLTSGGNKGFSKRSELMKESKQIELVTKLDIDVFKVRKFLINGVSMDITLHPTSSAFRLLSQNADTEYVLEVTDISLEAKLVTPSNQVLVAHQEVLKQQINAQYFYIREDLRKFLIPKATNTFFIEDMFNGRIPSTLAIAFVAADSLVGNQGKNPFHFSHHDLTHLNISLSGSPVPSGPLSFDFENGRCVQSYLDMYSDKANPPPNSQRITLQEFSNGYTIIVIKLNPHNTPLFFPAVRSGSLRLELRFSKQLRESVVLLSKVTYPGLFEVDYTRAVHIS